jgi:hypothetical protein
MKFGMKAGDEHTLKYYLQTVVYILAVTTMVTVQNFEATSYKYIVNRLWTYVICHSQNDDDDHSL